MTQAGKAQREREKEKAEKHIAKNVMREKHQGERKRETRARGETENENERSKGYASIFTTHAKLICNLIMRS